MEKNGGSSIVERESGVEIGGGETCVGKMWKRKKSGREEVKEEAERGKIKGTEEQENGWRVVGSLLGRGGCVLRGR